MLLNTLPCTERPRVSRVRHGEPLGWKVVKYWEAWRAKGGQSSAPQLLLALVPSGKEGEGLGGPEFLFKLDRMKMI